MNFTDLMTSLGRMHKFASNIVISFTNDANHQLRFSNQRIRINDVKSSINFPVRHPPRTKACQADHLLGFLKTYTSENIFLLGDIVDLWSMSRGGVHWTPSQNTFVQKMLRRARHGEQVVLIPGNHDEAIREYVGSTLGNIVVMHEYVHTAANGRRYLLIHGDEFDQVTLHHKWIAILGDKAYDVLVNLNIYLSWLRRTLKFSSYWSLAGYAKRKVKTAVSLYPTSIFPRANGITT